MGRAGAVVLIGALVVAGAAAAGGAAWWLSGSPESAPPPRSGVAEQVNGETEAVRAGRSHVIPSEREETRAADGTVAVPTIDAWLSAASE